MSLRRSSGCAAVAVLLALPLAASATSPPPLPAWLAGCWDGEGRTAGVTEAWSNGRIGQMLRVGASLRGARSNFEFMRIVTGADASLQFIAQPGGRPPVTFTARTVEPQRIVFANPAHDAPKAIEYRRDGDQLQVWLDPVAGAAPSFTFRRTSCDALFAPR